MSGTRKRIEQQARQQYIVEAARRVMAKKGVENTTMEDIAREADYSRRSAYTYFRSRDEIYLLALIEDLKTRWAGQQEALRTADSGIEQISLFARSFLTHVRKHPHSMPLQAWWDLKGIDPGRYRPETFASFEAINQALADGLRSIFRRAVDDGNARPDLDIDICISQFLYSLRAVVNRALSPGYTFARFDPEHYLEHFIDIFRRGISI
jgi:AcrR family transcriptional regulator